MTQSDGPDGHHYSHFADKLKHPFHELKEKLKDTHLEDAKIALHHQKCVDRPTPSPLIWLG